MQNPDEFIHQIGALIVTDPKFANLDWDMLSIIYDLSGGAWSSYGYIYRNDGSWEGRTPNENGLQLYKMTKELQAMMEQQTGKKWHKALVQIKRSEQSVDFIFEYDNPNRWRVSPATLEAVVAEVKP